jgi:hypothetical protein
MTAVNVAQLRARALLVYDRELSSVLAAVLDTADRSGVLVEHIDLLERKALCLGHAEVREDSREEARRAPDKEDLHAEVGVPGARVDEVGRGVADAEVPEPVGGSGHAHSLGANSEREDLAGDDPGDGAPGGCEACLYVVSE